MFIYFQLEQMVAYSVLTSQNKHRTHEWTCAQVCTTQ